MNFQKKIGIAIITFALPLILVSCSKEKHTLDVTSGKNEAISLSSEKLMSEDIDILTLRSSNSNCNPLLWLAECVEVEDSGEGVYPRTIILDYGDGCTNNNGITKSGVIEIILTGDMMAEGSTRTVTFVDFHVQNTSIEGTRLTTSLGTNEEGLPSFSKENDMYLERNGNEFERHMNHIVTWISGFDTDECGDNVFEVSGSGSCTRPNGNIITRTILDPIILDQTCGYIIQGIVEMNGPLGTRSIDFGDGNCDSLAEITTNEGEVVEIDLDNL